MMGWWAALALAQPLDGRWDVVGTIARRMAEEVTDPPCGPSQTTWTFSPSLVTAEIRRSCPDSVAPHMLDVVVAAPLRWTFNRIVETPGVAGAGALSHLEDRRELDPSAMPRPIVRDLPPTGVILPPGPWWVEPLQIRNGREEVRIVLPDGTTTILARSTAP